MSRTANITLLKLSIFVLSKLKKRNGYLKFSTDWAKAEVFSAKMIGLLSFLFFLIAIGFWQFGKTAMAKAFIVPMFVAGILVVAVSAGLYFANKPRIEKFEKAHKSNSISFIQTEIERTENQTGILNWFLQYFRSSS